MIGQTLAKRYHIIKLLGGGSFVQTYLAEDLQLPHKDTCIVKHLKLEMNDSVTLQEARHLFKTEAQVLKLLGTHAQISKLLADFEENQQFYLVQEFIEGESLSQILARDKQWSETQVVNLLQEILEILEFVHQQGVIHRNIKPSNLIRRRQNGKLVLIDFGAVLQVSTQAQVNFIFPIGTAGYVPREQAQGKPRLASDIYAVGMIGIQALTGITPRELPEAMQTGEIIWRDRVHISRKLAIVLGTMVRSHFARRYQNATEALQAIKALKSRPLLTSTVRRIDVNVVIGLISLLVAICSLIAAIVVPEVRQFLGLESPPEKVANHSVYKNSSYGIKINYPQNWEIQEIEDPLSGQIVRFLPKESLLENSYTELVVEIEKLTQPMSLNEYTGSSIKEIKQYLPEAKILNSSSAILGRREARRVIFTGKDEETNLKFKSMQVWMLKKNQAYSITYKSEESKYAKFLIPVEEVMIKSFEVY